MASQLEEYSKRELDRLEHDRQEAIKAKGGLPFFPKLDLGVTQLVLQAEIPHDNTDPQGNIKKLFTVTRPNDTEKFAWSVNPRSPLYRDLLEILPKAPINLQVIRTGQGKSDTRYSIKAQEHINK